MTTAISAVHKQRFTEIKNGLSELGSREAAFIRVELLFFEALNIAREYGSNAEENGLLHALKQLQADEYAGTAVQFVKAKQREKAIRRFINAFKLILTKAGKNSFHHESAGA